MDKCANWHNTDIFRNLNHNYLKMSILQTDNPIKLYVRK